MINYQFCKRLLSFCLSLMCVLIISTSPAFAKISDDAFEGNIFILFAGNGSLVPPRLTLTESLQRKIPTILVYYVDDSSDCKQFAGVVSRLQQYYGRAASLIPVSVDSMELKSSYTKDEVGYYYQGVVPQTVVLNENADVVFNGKGQVKFEDVDDALREVFNLLPRSQSPELKRRSFNEYNSELVN